MFLCGTGRRCARWVRVRDADSETGTTGEEGGYGGGRRGGDCGRAPLSDWCIREFSVTRLKC